jgi:tetratricopeptide (TPR) repeat protein
VAVAASLRDEPPGGIWAEFGELEKLDEAAAREVFTRIAGTGEPAADADYLLRELDGLPLALILVAQQARLLRDFGGLAAARARWDEEKTAMARSGYDETDKNFNLHASLRLSVEGPLMRAQPAALGFVSLLACLPDGLAQEDLAGVFPDGGLAAAATARAARLAYAQPGRLRMLNPAREFIRQAYPANADALNRAAGYYVALANEYGWLEDETGRRMFNGIKAAPRFRPDAANLETMILLSLNRRLTNDNLKAANALAEYSKYSGAPFTAPLRRAVELCGEEDEWQLEKANCIQSLGDIALARSDHDAARVNYNDAQKLYEQVGDVLGQANCIKSLGDIARERSDHDAARDCYTRAQPLFEQVGDVLGQANCILRLGDIARERSDHDAARDCYTRAQPLFEQVGAVLGQANCIKSLGDIALARSDHDAARDCYTRAQPLFEQVGDVLGQANCILRLGDIARERGETAEARARYGDALRRYQRIQEPYSIGVTYFRLAQVAGDAAERRGYADEARAAWTSIRRPDLVAMLDKVFGGKDGI